MRQRAGLFGPARGALARGRESGAVECYKDDSRSAHERAGACPAKSARAAHVFAIKAVHWRAHPPTAPRPKHSPAVLPPQTLVGCSLSS